MSRDVASAMEAGLWVPIYYGSRYKVARLKKDRCRTQEERPPAYPTLAAAQEDCDRLNRPRARPRRD